MTTNTENKTQYTTNDVGCYVDGARGIYAVDSIVAFAVSHGYELRVDDCDCLWHTDIEHNNTGLAGCEFSDEIEDAATEFMNENYSLESEDCYWGRNGNGDWGLFYNSECD